MTQDQYDKILWQKISRHTSLYDRTTPMFYYGFSKTPDGKKLIRILAMANENISLFKARHPEFTATWLKKDYLKV